MKRCLMVMSLTCWFGISAMGGEIPSVPGPNPPKDDNATITISNSESPGLGSEVPSVGYSQNVDLPTFDLVRFVIGLMV